MIETELWKLRRGPHDVVSKSTVSVDTITTQHDVSEPEPGKKQEQETEKDQDEGMSITAAKKNGARKRAPGRFKPPKTTAYKPKSKSKSKLTKSTSKSKPRIIMQARRIKLPPCRGQRR